VRTLLALTLALVASTTLLEAASAAERRQPGEYLWQCIAITRDEARYRCYSRLLLERIERSRDPASEVPEIDRDVEKVGGEILGTCHAVMHDVGRKYARAHRITLGTLRKFIPRSNNPRCSAGFGMGLVMYLGPQLVTTGGRTALADCRSLPTRFRAYTCIHGLGHALMRGFHGELEPAVQACRALGRHGADCAQGAFHDYWISLRGADGTTRPRNAVTSPRRVCDGRLTYVRPCWYRFFIEQRFSSRLESAADIRRLCSGLRPLQRAGCVAGAALAVSTNPFQQTRICADLAARDSLPCLRGVAVPAVMGRPSQQERLIDGCRSFEHSAPCYEWFGRTLALVTDGRFDCRGLRSASARTACRAGAARIDEPLVTFS